MKCEKCTTNDIELKTVKDKDTGMYRNYWNCDDCGETLPKGMNGILKATDLYEAWVNEVNTIWNRTYNNPDKN